MGNLAAGNSAGGLFFGAFEMKNQSSSFDISSFNAVADSEVGIDISMKLANGDDSGVIFTVIGKHADAVQVWTKKMFQAMQREEQMAKRRGKDAELLDIDKLREQNIEGACVRVIGWKNVDQPFDKELLKSVLRKNPHWVEQITDESNDQANFTKSN